MSGGFFCRLASIYRQNNKWIAQNVATDIAVLAGLAFSFADLLASNKVPDGFFDNALTSRTLYIVALVMVVYHFLWRLRETAQNARSATGLMSVLQIIIPLSLALSFGFFSGSPRLSIGLLVLFYIFLVIWHVQFLASSSADKAWGAMIFDTFGLICAIFFAYFALDLYEVSRGFFQTLPNYASDALAAEVVKKSFAGKQTGLVYTMGVSAGALAANAILAFFGGLVGDGKH